jgi:hypothetical protein
VTRDTAFEPAFQGKILNIPYPGTFTAQDKAADTLATVQTPAGGATIQVTLNRHKYVDFIIEDVATAQARSDLFESYVRSSAVAIAKAVETDLFALYTSLTGGTVGSSGNDVTAATIRNARKLLNDKNVPLTNRALVVSDKDEIALLGNPDLATYFAFAQRDAIANGSIGRLYGFDVYVSQLVPVVTGTPNSTKNLAIHQEAMILAVRPFVDPPPQSGVQVATVQDPETGLSLRVQYQYDMANRGVRVGLDILYGVAVLRPTAGVVVLS